MPQKTNRHTKDKSSGVRKKTFTGCWTCRARHLKCDEGKPSCLKCIKSRLSCEGYGVRLSWGSVACPDNFGTFGATGQRCESLGGTRQAASTWINCADISVSTPVPRASAPAPETLLQEPSIPSDDIVLELTDSDGLVGTPSSVAPPYPVFLVNGAFTPLPPLQMASPLGDIHTTAIHSASGVDHDSGLQDGELDPAADQSNDAPLDMSAASPHEQRVHASGESIRVDDPPYPSSSQRAPSVSHNTTHHSMDRPLDPLPDLNVERQLIEYFVSYLSSILMPVPIPSLPNYLNIAILPMALEGARLDRSTVSAASAVFHLVNSVSAFHLSNTANGDQREVWSKIALSHHNLALSNLQKAIMLNDPKQYVALLGSLLMCLIKETMTIGQSTWQVHVLGACHWVRRVDPLFWTESQTASFLYQFFSMIVAVAKTQLVTGDENDEVMAKAMSKFHHPNELFCLDQALGMPESAMEAIDNINDIRFPSSVASEVATTTEQTPILTTPKSSNSPDFLNFFEMGLLMSVPQPSTRPNLLAMIDDPSMLIYYHSCIHYYACIVYFKRIVRKTPLAEVQKYVSQSFDHLELIIKYTSRPCAPAIWPVAITLFEIADEAQQTRACRTLDLLFDKTRFEIWPKLKTVARSLWIARVNGTASADEPWPEFLKNLEPMRIILF